MVGMRRRPNDARKKVTSASSCLHRLFPILVKIVQKTSSLKCFSYVGDSDAHVQFGRQQRVPVADVCGGGVAPSYDTLGVSVRPLVGEVDALREVERVARMALAHGADVLRPGGPLAVVLARLDDVRR